MDGDRSRDCQTAELCHLSADEFEDLELGSNEGNRSEIPEGLSVDQSYLEGFLSAQYTEEADFDPESPANVLREVMGLNKQGKLTTSVSMFANRYSWNKALELFGAVEGAGAQTME